MKKVLAIVRVVIASVAIIAIYIVGSFYLHQQPYLGVIIGQVLAVVILDRLFLVVRWLTPLQGLFGPIDRERQLLKVMEREVSRSLRYQSPLVVLALRGKGRIHVKAAEKLLRYSDIVVAGYRDTVVILMTETQLEKARLVIQRLMDQLVVRAATVASEEVVRSTATYDGFGLRHTVKTNHVPTVALVRALQLGLFRSAVRHAATATLYALTDSDIITANTSNNAQALRDYTRRIA